MGSVHPRTANSLEKGFIFRIKTKAPLSVESGAFAWITMLVLLGHRVVAVEVRDGFDAFQEIENAKMLVG